jgi:5-formyltetrahydrofolate cyclo-ligase
LLRFESNDSHRHLRVAPSSFVTVHSPPTTPAELKALRRQLRAARKAVPAAQRRRDARIVARLAAQRHWLRPGRRIGLFLSMPEEIDTGPLVRAALRRGCHIFLPRVTDYRRYRMQFVAFNGRLRRSRYGISEPQTGRVLPARQLDLIFMPLVGFDLQGQRIGMGRGYYDRALGYLLQRQHWFSPPRVGVAFDCQQVLQLPTRAHDVPLTAVITPTGIRHFPRPMASSGTPA